MKTLEKFHQLRRNKIIYIIVNIIIAITLILMSIYIFSNETFMNTLNYFR
jgi:hypothetical protein